MHFLRPTHPDMDFLHNSTTVCLVYSVVYCFLCCLRKQEEKKRKKERYIIQLESGINVFQEAKLIVSLHSLQLCISPLLRDVNETRCTLDFGQRALKISSTAYVNINVSETAFLLLYLNMETALNFLVTTLFR